MLTPYRFLLFCLPFFLPFFLSSSLSSFLSSQCHPLHHHNDRMISLMTMMIMRVEVGVVTTVTLPLHPSTVSILPITINHHPHRHPWVRHIHDDFLPLHNPNCFTPHPHIVLPPPPPVCIPPPFLPHPCRLDSSRYDQCSLVQTRSTTGVEMFVVARSGLRMSSRWTATNRHGKGEPTALSFPLHYLYLYPSTEPS